MRLLRLQVERDLPAEVEVDAPDGVRVREVVHLLEKKDADYRLDGLVRAAVTAVVQVAEGVLVDEGKRRAAELARPVVLQAPALVLGQEVRGGEEALLGVAFAEHGARLLRAPPDAARLIP
jgi:hypothetical protein